MSAPATLEGVPPGALLDLWEDAVRLPPVERALALVTSGLVAGPPLAELRTTPVGRTHALLLDLHERLRGPRLEALAQCPGCGNRVEVALDLDDLRATKPGRAEATLVHGDHAVTWRSPTPDDLLAVADASDAPAALAARCLSVRTGEGASLAVADLDPAALPLVDDLLADADPLAEVVADVGCPDCGTAFEVDLDPVALVWAEVEAAAARLLHEVDVLARAYGWTQPEVLALGARRRAAYLSLVLEGVP